VSLKNLSKDLNRVRASRRQDFRKEQLLGRLDQQQRRYQSMVEERQRMNAARIRTLVESEIQREHVKNALYQMAVWNTFDPKIIYHIIGQEKQYEGQGMGGTDLTIEELVRKTAISQSRARKNKHFHMSSSVGF
jgi:hypothetical protein